MKIKLLHPLAILVCVSCALCRDAPTFSKAYSVSGSLYLPYAELLEPFDAWYDADDKLSRIDYYQGMVKTYQLGSNKQYGSTVQIVPVTTETSLNVPTCFGSDGSEDSPVSPQALLPDISNFKYIGTEVKNGYQCEVWRELVKNFNRTSSYTIYIRWQKNAKTPSLSEPIPVRYEMKGYNSLIGSHYDHYYIDYYNFVLGKPKPEVFKVSENVSCADNTADVSDHHSYHFNPMKEFIDRHTGHIDHAWDKYKTVHSKSYDDQEHEKRKGIFTHNLRYIHSTNRQGLGYTLKVNHLADKSDDELKQIRGRLYNPKYNGGNEFPYTSSMIDMLSANLPDSFDWRIHGAVTPVKDQATCGSCWSFGATGAVEGAYFLKTGNRVSFSQQALVDCSWGFGNNGCDGGLDYQAYQWIMKHGGIPTDEDYGYYRGQDGYCHIDTVNLKSPIKSYVNVTTGENNLRVALFNHGPISVSIDASHKSFSFYSNGVYFEKECNNQPDGLDHSVLAVGYGSLDGQNYWLIKNSWSNHWGNQGYVLMSSKDNNCGVETEPTYVNLD